MEKITQEIRKFAAFLVAKSIDDDVIAFLKENPNPSDAQVHTFAEEKDIDVHKLEAVFYRLSTKYVQQLMKNKKASDAKGFSVNIEKDTIDNVNFRKVLYTGNYMQLVLMSLKPGEDIGDEVHGVDQFFRFEEGTGEAVINGHKYPVADGSSVVVPANSKHNIKNTGEEDLKLYSIYSPPHHEDGTMHKTKDIAMKDDEEFEGTTTEK